MAKSILKLKAHKLRFSGSSIKDIARALKVSQSTVSLWCRNIKLSQKQLNKILDTKEYLIARGRMKGAMFQRLKRINAIKQATKEALALAKLTDKEFFIAGLSLYLAEGTKTYGTVQFTNSNKQIIKFMVEWFRRFFNVRSSDIKYSVHINVMHKYRETEIINFWKKYLKVSNQHFTKVRYAKILSKKRYENHGDYFGTMDFRIKKSTNLLYRLNALTDRLLNIPKL